MKERGNNGEVILMKIQLYIQNFARNFWNIAL